ncbi:hypothetical protein J7F03_39715 [Streptomyces sp. ISL-43]|nr:hypothetical protein [Streptomyces sp. ISL-43]MBT2453049.1 hypothetical protein [Streptomyces sp. ISL-43]
MLLLADRGLPGAHFYRLITTLMDPAAAPAAELAALYGERWEVENILAELKTTQIGTRTVMPSKSPDLVFQEVYAHLVLYTDLRVLMHRTAVNRSEPLDPDRLSFAAALRAARRSITTLNRDFPPQHLSTVARELEEEINPPRRLRAVIRQAKRKMSRFRPGTQTGHDHHSHPADQQIPSRSSWPSPPHQTPESTALCLEAVSQPIMERAGRTGFSPGWSSRCTRMKAGPLGSSGMRI